MNAIVIAKNWQTKAMRLNARNRMFKIASIKLVVKRKKLNAEDVSTYDASTESGEQERQGQGSG